jgi:hypothetical protein
MASSPSIITPTLSSILAAHGGQPPGSLIYVPRLIPPVLRGCVQQFGLHDDKDAAAKLARDRPVGGSTE